MKETRSTIIESYAGWTALSALRSGSPVKSRADVYGLVNHVPFDVVLVPADEPINAGEFASWHHDAVMGLCKRESRLCVGWAAKIVNVYLKTTTYVGGLGRLGLVDLIHPPIDGGLWAGVRMRFGASPDILAKTHVVERIQNIRDYSTYATIIAGMRDVSAVLGCTLIEVETLWDRGGESSA